MNVIKMSAGFWLVEVVKFGLKISYFVVALISFKLRINV